MFGREPLLPLNVMLGQRTGPQRPQSYNNFAMDWEKRMSEAYKIARGNVKKVK